MKKKAAALCLLGVMTLGTCTVSAASGTRNISATFRNIKIVVDGRELTTSAEPFIYNGTTYLPIRAVGEAVGKEVTWNAGTSTVYLGEVPASAQQPAAPASAASPANLPILMESTGLDAKGMTSLFSQIQSGVMDASVITGAYLENMEQRLHDAQYVKACYAEAQAALSLLTGTANFADIKAEFEGYYQSKILPNI